MTCCPMLSLCRAGHCISAAPSLHCCPHTSVFICVLSTLLAWATLSAVTCQAGCHEACAVGSLLRSARMSELFKAKRISCSMTSWVCCASFFCLTAALPSSLVHLGLLELFGCWCWDYEALPGHAPPRLLQEFGIRLAPGAACVILLGVARHLLQSEPVHLRTQDGTECSGQRLR